MKEEVCSVTLNATLINPQCSAVFISFLLFYISPQRVHLVAEGGEEEGEEEEGEEVAEVKLPYECSI